MVILFSALLLVSAIFFTLYVTKFVFGQRRWILAPTNMFSIYFLGISFIGVVQASYETQSSKALIAHVIWFFGMIVGLLLFSLIVPNRSATRLTDITSNASVRLVGRESIFYFFIALGILSVVVTFWFYERIPLIIGLKSLLSQKGELLMHQARQMNTLTHRSGDTIYFGQGYLRHIYTVVAPVFCVSLYLKTATYLRGETTVSAKIFFPLFVLFGFLNGQIWVGLHIWIYFILAIVFILIAYSGNSMIIKLTFRAIVAYFSLLGLVFLYRYLQMISGRTFEGGFVASTFHRIYGYNQIKLFEIFPDEMPFRYGATWLNDLSGMLPGAIESFAYEVHNLVYGGGWGYSLSPGIVASSYVNFGFFGVFLTAVFVSILFSRFYSSLVQTPSAVRVGLGLMLTFKFALGVSGDFSNYIIEIVTAMLILTTYLVMNSGIAAIQKGRA